MHHRHADAAGGTYFSAVNLATKTNKVKLDLICLGRRIARKLDNLDTIAYGYDKAGRVTSIKFNNEAPVSYEWDAASRLTVKTLSNGVRMEYQYDAASRLLGITYRKPDATVINSIAYGYDAKGQRTSKPLRCPATTKLHSWLLMTRPTVY